MQAGKAIYYLLSNNTDVKSLIGGKIHPVRIPEKTGFPAMVYAFPSQAPTRIKDGGSPLDEIECTVTLYVDDYAKGVDAMTAVRSALDQQRGTIQGVSIDSIIFDSGAEDDFFEEYQFFVFVHRYNIRLKR